MGRLSSAFVGRSCAVNSTGLGAGGRADFSGVLVVGAAAPGVGFSAGATAFFCAPFVLTGLLCLRRFRLGFGGFFFGSGAALAFSASRRSRASSLRLSRLLFSRSWVVPSVLVLLMIRYRDASCCALVQRVQASVRSTKFWGLVSRNDTCTSRPKSHVNSSEALFQVYATVEFSASKHSFASLLLRCICWQLLSSSEGCMGWGVAVIALSLPDFSSHSASKNRTCLTGFEAVFHAFFQLSSELSSGQFLILTSGETCVC